MVTGWTDGKPKSIVGVDSRPGICAVGNAFKCVVYHVTIGLQTNLTHLTF